MSLSARDGVGRRIVAARSQAARNSAGLVDADPPAEVDRRRMRCRATPHHRARGPNWSLQDPVADLGVSSAAVGWIRALTMALISWTWTGGLK